MSRDRPEPDLLWMTALHESAHAVANARFGISGSVSMRSEPVPGVSLLSRFDAKYPNWQNQVIALLAGLASDLRVGKSRRAARSAVTVELNLVRGVLAQNRTGGQATHPARRLTYWIGQAQEFIARPRNWRAIVFLGHELIDHVTLDEVGSSIEFSDGDLELGEYLMRKVESGLIPLDQAQNSEYQQLISSRLGR